MVKMIISVPGNFDVKRFMSVVTSVARDRLENDGTVDYYEISLDHFTGYERRVDYHTDAFSIDGSLVELNVVDIIVEMQALCPQVEIYFENSGGESPFEGSAYDEDYYCEALHELYCQ